MAGPGAGASDSTGRRSGGDGGHSIGSIAPPGSPSTRREGERARTPPPPPTSIKVQARRASIYAANIFGLLRQGAGVCSTEHEDNAALEVIEANLPALVDKTDIGLKRKREETVGSIMALYLGAINARAALQTYKEARAMRGDDDQHYDSVVENNGGTHRD